MLKKANRKYFFIGITTVLFVSVSSLALISIERLRGNANVINYAGIVRGGTQKLIKKELMGYTDDVLMERLDDIVRELQTGNGENGLVVLDDAAYMEHLKQVNQAWEVVKKEIRMVRNGSSKERLFQLSEEYFDLADETVSSAVTYSEQQVASSTRLLITVNLGVLALIAVVILYFIRMASLEKKAVVLNKIAYLDALTNLANRTSCEAMIASLTEAPPSDDIAVLIFDLNNLKMVNDVMGHQSGDKVIVNFAKIIKMEDNSNFFVSRYGGDEFITIITHASKAEVDVYLSLIKERTAAHNSKHKKEWSRISYAVGCSMGNMNNKTVQEMINEADHNMYEMKQEMKEDIHL